MQLLVFNVILNVFMMISGYLALGRIYEKKRKFIWLKVICIFMLSLAQALIIYIEKPYLNSITMIADLIVMTKLMFKCNKISFLLYDTFIALCYFISDLISNLAVSVAIKSTVSATLHRNDLILSRYLLNMILVFMLCNSIAVLFGRRKNDAIYWYEVMAYILLSVFEAASASYISHYIQKFSFGMFLIFFLMGCFILDVYIVFVFYRLAESRKLEENYLLIKQQSNIQLEVYRELSKKYENSMSLVHDAKKHVDALKDLIESEKASAYYDSLYKKLNKLCPEFHHSNQMLSVIINHALFKSEQSNIRVDLHIEEFKLSFISDMDLTTIFANILDNSIEACRMLSEEKRFIRLYVEHRIGFVLIHITNPYESINSTSEEIYNSTKSGHIGIGLSNVKQTVEKYNGIFNIETADMMFTVSITIPEVQ